MAQGLPPRRSARAAGGREHAGARGRRRPERGRPRLGAFDDDVDRELPPWAGPGIQPSAPAAERRPTRLDEARSPDVAWRQDGDAEWPPAARADARRSRRAAAQARKHRRRLLAAAGLIVVAGVVVTLWAAKAWPFGGQAPRAAGAPLVTTFQPGEFHAVPDACDAVPAALVQQYLPGKVAQVSQSLGSATQSQCTWTLDARPDFRVLTVSSQAYTPSLLATGDGSATFSAIDAYGQARRALQDPPKSSRAPRAQIGAAAGLGTDAFTALQVFHVGGDTTAEVTVVARDRNVLTDITMQGQEHGGGFSPVPVATLRAAALAAAREVLAGFR